MIPQASLAHSRCCQTSGATRSGSVAKVLVPRAVRNQLNLPQAAQRKVLPLLAGNLTGNRRRSLSVEPRGRERPLVRFKYFTNTLPGIHVGLKKQLKSFKELPSCQSLRSTNGAGTRKRREGRLTRPSILEQTSSEVTLSTDSTNLILLLIWSALTLTRKWLS